MRFFVLPLAAFSLLHTMPALAQGKGPQGPIQVIVTEAYTDRFVDRVEALGTLKANESIVLASTVTETVSAVNFTDGQRVAKGDVLVEMADGEEKALLDQQRALVNEAKKQLDRTQDLAKSGAASSAILDERQRQYTAARAGLSALQSRLEDHIIVAPFDGIVGLRNTSVGALLQPGTAITTLDDDSVMKLDFTVPSIFLSAIGPGLEIIAKASGYKESFKGQITAVDSQVDSVTRAVTVRAMIPNPNGALKPGLLMSVKLLKNPRDSVGIPENAIVPEGRKAFVFVLDESKEPPVLEKREIIIGTRREGDLEVLENLVPGEKVVVQGTMMARPGAPVAVTAVQKRGESLSDLLKRISSDADAPQAENNAEKE